MRILNRTRGTVVASQSGEAKSFRGRLVGLMGRKGMPVDTGLVIDRTNWIHTFWMYFPLDVIYINKNWIVVGIETELKPNRLGKLFWSAQSVIELNAGVITVSETQVGDQLELIR